MSNFSNIIFISQSLTDDEEKGFKDSLNSLGMFKINFFKDIQSSIKFIKSIEFEDTFIIISGNLYDNLINTFNENLNNISIIPKIIIFEQNKQEFINRHNSNSKNDQFYNYGGIKTSFIEIKDFIKEQIKNYQMVNKEEIPQLIFEYIDSEEKLLFPILYRAYIEVKNREEINKFTKIIFEKYHKKSKAFQQLLGPIKNISNIPIELLSKYYARLYTEENSHFYRELNKDLRENKKENYIPFIQVLYEGVKLKSIPLGSNNILYRGCQISFNEIEKIKNYLNNKKINLPAAYVFSKSFLSFSKEKRIALNFLNSINNNNNLEKVLFILDKDDTIDHNNSSHADIEKISFYPNEKEVLFFPFSSFEIKSIQIIKLNNEKIYEIKILYLGKYLDKLKSKKKIINNENILPNSEFKKSIIEQGLIQPKEIQNKKIKSIIKKYDEYTKDTKNKKVKQFKIKYMMNFINSEYMGTNLNNIYNNRFIIFGKNFVNNNFNKCKVIIDGKVNNLEESYEIKLDFSEFGELIIKEIEPITDMSYMFYFSDNNNNCFYELNLIDWDTSNIINMSHMFENNKYIIKSNSFRNTSNVKDMSFMFCNTHNTIDLLNIPNWDVSNVIDMNHMFENSKVPDISNWDISQVRNISYMFSGCPYKENKFTMLQQMMKTNNNIFFPNISKWNTSRITDMNHLFYNFNLNILPDISKWNTSNVKDLSFIFAECDSLISLPAISNWNTSNLINMKGMFGLCYSLKSIPNISKWDFSKVTDMSFLFFGLTFLPDISKFYIPKTVDKENMIYQIKNYKVDKWNIFFKNKNRGYGFNICAEYVMKFKDLARIYLFKLNSIFDSKIKLKHLKFTYNTRTIEQDSSLTLLKLGMNSMSQIDVHEIIIYQ